MAQATYFVRIDNPSDLRKQVLENSKSVIESLRRFEKIKDMRAEKLNNIIKLKQIMSEIFELTSRLRSTMPQAKMTPTLKKRPMKKAEKSQLMKMPAAKPISAPKARPSNDLDKLESELSEVESRLSKLG